MGQYLPIVALAALAIVFAGLSRVASRLLAPALPTVAKSSPYECGIEPTQETNERFPVRFYLVAMIFIVFDVEIIFLFPWATVYQQLGTFGLGAVIIFSFALFESFVYLIGNGALEWGPADRQRRTDVVSPGRTLSSTVRRVGLEGRPVNDTVSEQAA